ncbi:ABC transporter substrate-binding protein [Candidatus Bathyarchaeota archaeon]|nr:MAG: ABC transporter substrate-binding protein [Candidatus Bathyarchaeota archaeon]
MRGRSGVSTAVAVAAVIVAILIGVGIGIAAAPSIVAPATVTSTVEKTVEKTETVTTTVGAGATVTVTSTASVGKTVTVTSTATKTVAAGAGGLTGEIPIGAIIPLTGVLASFGQNNKVAAEIAVEEVNEFLEEIGAGWRLKLYVEDTETKPSVALEKLMALHSKGVKVVIGPMASSGVKAIKEYADSNKILVISPSSTSPALAIPDDYIFRFPPTDELQGRIAPRFAKDIGATHIIVMWRGDAWGDCLADVVKKRAAELGIEVAKEIRYAPEATEFSAEVATLASAVDNLVSSGVSPDKIVVVVIGFEEVRAILLDATEYDVLWRVKWFGSDGTALSSKLIEDPKVAEFSAAVRFVNPIAGSETKGFWRLVEKVKERIGRIPESYSVNTYDAIWIVAHALLITDRYDGEALKNVFMDVVDQYYGANGHIVLNEAGDRAYANYLLWEIVKADGGYEWKLTGRYDYETDVVKWS